MNRRDLISTLPVLTCTPALALAKARKNPEDPIRPAPGVPTEATAVQAPDPYDKLSGYLRAHVAAHDADPVAYKKQMYVKGKYHARMIYDNWRHYSGWDELRAEAIVTGFQLGLVEGTEPVYRVVHKGRKWVYIEHDVCKAEDGVYTFKYSWDYDEERFSQYYDSVFVPAWKEYRARGMVGKAPGLSEVVGNSFTFYIPPATRL